MKLPVAWHQSHQHTTYNTTKQSPGECPHQNQPYTHLYTRLLKREQGKSETIPLVRLDPVVSITAFSAERPADSGIELHNL
ncbi:hypothetical protein K443DRAFT_47819, partial [Laccaria amethystina LaAM-08-1]